MVIRRIKQSLYLFIVFLLINSNIKGQAVDYDRIILKFKSGLINKKAEEKELLNIVSNFKQIHYTRVFRKFENSFMPIGNKQSTELYVDLSLIFEIQLEPEIGNHKVISDLKSSGYFEYVQPYYIPQLCYVPNDPFNIGSQYYLNNIRAYEAWDTCRGDSNITIGIVDTGVDIDHEDLIQNIAYNYADPINGIDDDNDGFIDNFRGWDLGENDNNPQSNENHHGGQVAGVAAARTDNGIGISGVGFKTKFLPVKASDANGQLTQVYEGIVYAADHGCKIINCSWGDTIPNPYGQDIINYATFNRGALVVAAAGNANNDTPYFPASYENVMSVAGTDINDVKWENSSFSYSVDIAAPGDNIYFTKNDNAYGSGWGTSYAAPIVSAGAAILSSRYPELDMLQIAALLKNTTDNIDTISSNLIYANKLGTGRLNLYKAINDSITPAIEVQNLTVYDSTRSLSADFINYLAPSDNLYIDVSSLDENVVLQNDNIDIGILGTYQIYTLAQGIVNYEIQDDFPFDKEIALKFEFSDGSYKADQFIKCNINKSYLDIEEANINTTLTANGRLGFNKYWLNQGQGFVYKGQYNFLYEGGLIIANSVATVTDNLYGNINFKPKEKVVSSIDSNMFKRYYSVFNDSLATNTRLGIEVECNYLIGKESNMQDFIIIEYNIQNKSINSYTNLYAGLYTDWDIAGSANDRAEVNADMQLIYAWNVTNPVYYAAIQLLNFESTNYYAFDNSIGGNGGIDLQDGFTETEKFDALTQNRLSAGYDELGNDVATMISAGPINLQTGENVKLAFAIHANTNLFNLLQSAEISRTEYFKYTNITKPESKTISDYVIFPNPLKKNGRLTVSVMGDLSEILIYDLSGKVILMQSFNKKESSYVLSTNKLERGIYFILPVGNKRVYEAKKFICF